MKNQFGLDCRYFREQLYRLARQASHATPEEMQRSLESLSDVARQQHNAAKAAAALDGPRRAC